jgi:hypothetical protein
VGIGESVPLWRRIPEGGRANVVNIIMVAIPLYDQEILGSLQLGFLPGVDRIPVWTLLMEDQLWFAVLVLFILIPYVDGEALRVLQIYPEAWEVDSA